MRREKTQISVVRNKKRELTINTKEIQGIIRFYFEKLYSNKLENLEEMDKFLDTYDHPNLNQEDINHLNTYIAYNEIEEAIGSQKKKV
jgi:CRISPR type III-B/RAMP module RAMP protein Cmr1